MDKITVFSVFEITRHLKQVVESSIAPLYVQGEIAGFVHHSSGHMYFNLKDEYSSLRCTFFRNRNYKIDFHPQNGQNVICFGQMTVYEKGGSYNLNVTQMLPSGMGDMQMKFEALKKKLEEEGLFAADRKRALPKYPQEIGIITSPTGAALQDIQNVLTRRYPVRAWVYPALVQGNEAPKSMIKGLRYFNSQKPVDLIILTRGGGSQEDLFCFNDEALVREIAASQIPVISAVGHEIDFTISDFVADHRAPTPSAAAELAVPNRDDLLSYLKSISQKMQLLGANRIGIDKQRLHESQMELISLHPQSILREYMQRLDMASMALDNVKHKLSKPISDLALAQHIFMSTARMKLSSVTASHDNETNRHGEHLQFYADRLLERLNSKLNILEQNLEQYSVASIQKRGWILARKDEAIVHSIAQIAKGDSLELVFRDGRATVEVKDKQ